MDETAIIDRAKLDALRQELGGGLGRVIGYFREDGAKSIAAIEEAVRQRDAVALVRPAHTLKGEALQLGATQLGMMAYQIEKAGRQAVEDHVFPIEVIEHVVCLRKLFDQALSMLAYETIPQLHTMRRTPAAGFGRKVSSRCA